MVAMLVLEMGVDGDDDGTVNENKIAYKSTACSWLNVHTCVCSVTQSCLKHFATPWTVACQAPQSMGFPRQEYWDGLPFPTPGDLPNPGIELLSPVYP